MEDSLKAKFAAQRIGRYSSEAGSVARGVDVKERDVTG
jgi:hypothetical protein